MESASKNVESDLSPAAFCPMYRGDVALGSQIELSARLASWIPDPADASISTRSKHTEWIPAAHKSTLALFVRRSALLRRTGFTELYRVGDHSGLYGRGRA